MNIGFRVDASNRIGSGILLKMDTLETKLDLDFNVEDLEPIFF